MTRPFLPSLILAAIGLALTLSGCTTVETRINEYPQVYRSLSPRDQQLVAEGKIHEGLPREAVYIAWGPPSQRIPGRFKGQIVETWVYDATVAGDYPGPFYYGSPYGYGLGYGYWGGGYRHRFNRGHFFYDPFYDPYFYSHANIIRYPERTVSFQNGRVIRYPERTVSFQNGRVIGFQFLPTPRIY